MHITDIGRRNTIIKTIKGISGIAFGGLLWSAYLSKTKASEVYIRPPGALDENNFIKSCIKCGLCVESCPFDTLKLAKLEDNTLIGTPYFTPREIPCYMCVDFPCVKACPTKALDDTLLIKDGIKSINNAKMGVAVVDNSSCIAYFGIQCDACYRSCPLIDSAIKLEYKENKNTNKHAYLIPIINNDICTGCGICERVCVTKKPAITIINRKMVIGSVDNHYIQDVNTHNKPNIQTNRNIKDHPSSAIKYLNQDSITND